MMKQHSISGRHLLLVVSLPLRVLAQSEPSLVNTVEKGMNTECKNCPWTLCTNRAYYESEDSVTLTCWTHGTEIAGDRDWLKTSDGCYVTQYDLTLYNGSYESDLSYCGRDSEQEFYTKQSATTKFDTECNIDPWIDSDTVQYLAPGHDLTVTCWTDDGDLIINDSTWLKTTSNCYVAQIGLTHPATKATLDNCGPIPFLEVNVTGTDPPQDPEDGFRRSTTRIIPKSGDLNKRYLINVTVGEDFALCHSEPSSASTVDRRYEWDEEIWLQCLVWNEDTTDQNETFWSWTTDFCYVRSVDLWQSPEGDYYRFPTCDKFT